MTDRPFLVQRGHTQGVIAVSADTDLRFGKHMHDEFGIGLMVRGAQKSASGSGVVEACEGDLITVNPGEIHDGTPLTEQGRAWHMLYLDPVLVAGLAHDISEGRCSSSCEFTAPVLSSQVLTKRFRAAFLSSIHSTSHSSARSATLSAEENLLLLLAALLQPAPSTKIAVSSSIDVALSCMDDDPLSDLSLPYLASLANLSQYQFLRGFLKTYSITPHAYLMQKRVQHARRLIASGATLSAAAIDSGFSDQSHMTRVFTRSLGMTPGVYAKAVKG